MLLERSTDGNQYYYLVYGYNINSIDVQPMKDLIDATIIKLFDEVLKDIERKGYTPRLDINDNQEAVLKMVVCLVVQPQGHCHQEANAILQEQDH